MIRCPVTSGTDAGNRWCVGRGTRIGHRCVIVSFFSPPSGSSNITRVSSIVYSPSFTTSFTVPSTSGGIIHLWRIACVSGTSAIISPPWRYWPFSTTMWVFHFFSLSSESTLTPLVINAPPVSAILSSGRSIPSNILFRIPGASVTETAFPLATTSSPGLSPVVSSYTWIVVLSLSRAITSPTNFCFPT